ncbi:hypothetical protein C447_12702 [Halococcus hamelinensis 100A6]|uniref:Uncharacterized protein n=1 Tax=Halococcus hamelinensis 100A6 TaxID=1132509 RepID=M0LZN8_9EURY|nr:hypothetical protein C447_12702 [Halococcus hamelinensis 100A6]
MMAGTHDVSKRQKRFECLFVVLVSIRYPNQGSTSMRHTDLFSLRSAFVATPGGTIHTRGSESLPTELTGTTTDSEWCKYTVPGFDMTNGIANVLDDTHRFVTDR